MLLGFQKSLWTITRGTTQVETKTPLWFKNGLNNDRLTLRSKCRDIAPISSINNLRTPMDIIARRRRTFYRILISAQPQLRNKETADSIISGEWTQTTDVQLKWSRTCMTALWGWTQDRISRCFLISKHATRDRRIGLLLRRKQGLASEARVTHQTSSRNMSRTWWGS